jgi:hypothetical protein
VIKICKKLLKFFEQNTSNETTNPLNGGKNLLAAIPPKHFEDGCVQLTGGK